MSSPATASTAASTSASRHDWGLLARLVAVPAIWGGTFIAGRVMMAAMPPTVGALFRYLVASLALWVAAHVMEGGLPRLQGRQWWVTALLGATGILAYNLFFFGALTLLPASRTSLLVALNPIVTISLGVLLLRERLTAWRWLGVVVALLGVWVVISRGDVAGALSQSVSLGEALMFGGVCSWAAYTLIGRTALKGLSPLAATTYASLWGTAMLALAALPQIGSVQLHALTPPVLASIVYLGLIGTGLAFVWYYQGVQRLGAARTVVVNNLVPVFGTAFGVLLLGEPLLPSMLWGGLLAVGGVMLASGAVAPGGRG